MIIKSSIKWGLILGIFVSIATQILTWMGLGLTNWFVLISIILTILFVGWACHKIQLAKGGKLSFANAILIVLVVVLIARFVFQGYMFTYTRYIDPQWVETVALKWTETLQISGAPQEQIDVQIESFRKSYELVPMFTSTLILFGIPQFIFGFLTSLFFVFDIKKRFKRG